MAWDNRLYGNQTETTCIPIEDANLAVQLQEAPFPTSQGILPKSSCPTLGEEMRILTPSNPRRSCRTEFLVYACGRRGVITVKNSRMVPPELNQTAKERVIGLIGLRELCAHTLMDYQLGDYPDARHPGKTV